MDTKNIQIYSKSITRIEAVDDTVIINLDGVDVSQVVAEFSTAEILHSLDYSQIVDYVNETEKDKLENE